MSAKITVIGAGNVGASIAYTLSLGHTASEIVVIDINKSKAEGEVMDIVQGASFRDPISIITGDYDKAADSDIVIITSGVGRKPGQSRMDLAQINVDILKDIIPKITAVSPESLYLIVSNPVDIMTYAFTKLSGIPERQIIGSGTILDTSRLRYYLSQREKIAQKNIHAYVYGEHGDTSFIPWSCAEVSGCSLFDYEELATKKGVLTTPLDQDLVLDYVRKSGSRIIERKRATFYGISVAISKLCDVLMGSSNSIATISSMMHGEYGIDDVCLSTMTIIGPNGVDGKLVAKLTQDETEKLIYSANALKSVISELNI